MNVEAHPWKINIESENGWLDDVPLPGVYSQVPS